MMSVLMYVLACPICELSYTVGPQAYHDSDCAGDSWLLAGVVEKVRVSFPPTRVLRILIGAVDENLFWVQILARANGETVVQLLDNNIVPALKSKKLRAF